MSIKRSPRLAIALAATAAAGFSGVAIAGAASNTTSTPSSPTAPTQQQRPNGGPGAGETALTGDTKQKVEAAALAKVPGTVVRSETDNGGVYEAHIRKSDGTEVEVKVDKDFNVTAVNTQPAGGRGFGRGGRGGGMGANLAAVAKDLGVSTSTLQKAVESARPAKDAHGDFAAAIAKELGVSTSDVQAVLDANRPTGRPAPGSKPDDSALVSALASKFSIGQDKVQAALDAVHKAQDANRTTAMDDFYAAVGKSLGKDASAVKQAFEANRPAMPGR